MPPQDAIASFFEPVSTRVDSHEQINKLIQENEDLFDLPTFDTSSVNEIDKILEEFQNQHLITEMDRDALRHYYGMRSLSNRYGSTAANIAGYLHEGIDLLLPTENKLQSSIYIYNNKIALQDILEGRGSEFREDISSEELRNQLLNLKIPPSWRNIK